MISIFLKSFIFVKKAQTSFKDISSNDFDKIQLSDYFSAEFLAKIIEKNPNLFEKIFENNETEQDPVEKTSKNYLHKLYSKVFFVINICFYK